MSPIQLNDVELIGDNEWGYTFGDQFFVEKRRRELCLTVRVSELQPQNPNEPF